MNIPVQKITSLAAAIAIALSALPTAGVHAYEADAIPSGMTDSLQKEHRHPEDRPKRFHAGYFIVATSAKLFEMDPKDLVSQLKSGKTLSGLAKEKKGWSEEQYIQKLCVEAELKVNEAVTGGQLTEAEAKSIKAGLPLMLKQHLAKMGRFKERNFSGHHINQRLQTPN